MQEISNTLWQALLLVILVVFVFLQGWRPTLIPLLAVPVSLIGTFILFPVFGFSVNTLSLFGLVLAIGLVVDDAIVVVEAVEHHIEEGMSPRDATIKAMEEVSGPVVAIAIILAAVFIPTAFIPGITGRLYQQFALTIAISVIISAFNALSLSPALCAMLLRPKGKSRARPARRVLRLVQPGLRAGDRGLRRHLAPPDPQERPQLRRSSACFAVAALPRSGRQLPSSFLPEEDQGYVYVATAAAERLLAPADERGRPQGRGRPQEHAGREDLHLGHRLQPPEHRLQHLQRLLLRQLQAVVRADEARGELRRRSRPT